jgi:pathogenesis-related protein 1
MQTISARSRTAHFASILALALLGGCDRDRQVGPIEPEPAPVNSSAPAHADAQRPPARHASTKPSPAADPFAEGFVAAHNLHRARVSPAAKPALPSVTWSNELAAQARAWAERCQFDHSKTDLGENLSARTDMADPEVIVAAWAAEGESFDYARNRCASGEVCGHYTQVVWRDSTQIGCGVAQCGGGGPFGDHEWVMWVCNYSPAGNWSGQRPY